MDAAGPWIDAANPEHPSLIDQAHILDELFGVVNVPTGIWIDEDGVVVRPPETAFPLKRGMEKLLRTLPEGLDPYLVDVLVEVKKVKYKPDKYIGALKDWVDKGRDSRFALSPEEVTSRTGSRSMEASTAAAHFEIGQHLHRNGNAADAIGHFRKAHELQPENWTYKRQAWTFVNPMQGPTIEHYDTDFLSEVRKVGAENYYPALEM